MKLFNWIQRKPHHTAWKDEVAKNEESIITNGLADGMLTIGTLGLDLDPLKCFTQHNDYFVLEEEEESDIDSNDEEPEQYDSFSVDSDDSDEEDEIPLVFTRFENMYEEMEINSSGFDAPRERVTLAELFMADSEVKKEIVDYVEVIEKDNASKKLAKNGLFFAKKLIPHFKEDSRPIKKIHKMVKRMLKRKIHPEVEEGKGDGGKIGTVARGIDIADSACVLPTQLALASGSNV